MLRLRVRIERRDRAKSIDVVGIASSGFTGVEPEVLLPVDVANELRLPEVAKPDAYTKITGDGREVELLRYRYVAKVYVVTEDRIEGPVISTVLLSPRARYVLLNDKLLGKLRVVLLDFGEGLWCFRDELGKRERRGL
ncbi:MAG: hypothetical protein DRO39_04980 [Thermoprotei archaeon]|nr:MAG: hypothetical protein DRO39_04980 [Thermoprotei archaeon]